MDISDITHTGLQNEIIALIIVNEYREKVTKRMEDGGYMNFLAGYTKSVFQDFEGYLRTEVDLVEDDIKLVLDGYNSTFITYEIEPLIYSFKDLSETFLKVFNLNIQHLAAKLLLNLMMIPVKLKWLSILVL